MLNFKLIFLTICVIGIVLYTGVVTIPEIDKQAAHDMQDIQKWIDEHPGEELPIGGPLSPFQFINLLGLMGASFVIGLVIHVINVDFEVPDGR